jgi:hexosaminidase
VSPDSETFTPIGGAEVDGRVGRNTFAINRAVRARYVRIAVKHPGKIPEGHAGAGNPAWLFLDEIEVR